MFYLKCIFIGGQIPGQGDVGSTAPINFETGTLKFFIMGTFLILITPLVFVQSSFGFIPFINPESFTGMSKIPQYMNSLGYTLLYILKSLSVGDGFPPEMPIPKTDNWKIMVSIYFFVMNGLGVTFLFVSGKRIVKNHRTYNRRIR